MATLLFPPGDGLKTYFFYMTAQIDAVVGNSAAGNADSSSNLLVCLESPAFSISRHHNVLVAKTASILYLKAILIYTVSGM